MRGRKDKTTEASSGYIQMSEAVSGGQEVSPYIQVSQVSEMPEVKEGQPGYSVHTMSPGGLHYTHRNEKLTLCRQL